MFELDSQSAKYFLGGDGLHVYRAKRFILVINTQNNRSKVLQIFFWKDGSIFVDFPFFEHSNGIVSLITHPPNAAGPVDISLLDGGKATSHLVKYSHHPDGNALFSQTGKVYSKVRKKSVPISDIQGHFFTAHVQNLDAFEKYNYDQEQSTNPKEKSFIEVNFQKETPPAIKIVGRLYSRENLRNRSKQRYFGPIIPTKDPSGKLFQGCIISFPAGINNDNQNLLITCEVIPRIERISEAALSFIGGFDNKSIIEDATRSTTFLAFAYPAENVDDLAKQIGSIDFNREEIAIN